MSRSHKGSVAWNKGKKMSQKTKDKISKNRKGIPAWNKGFKWSKELKEAMQVQYKEKINKGNGKIIISSLQCDK